ncbi:hypothetical protein CEXT_678291 [Caerostris extrusa]|uniref:Uncharacterized protein n=1 Tax=Caerostris extrusa TaxID=172846 RepID=A0AAV4VQD8_CAEEX|nr:hypothetical protein CEXT_678291 [Caerostris extrusa]
MRVTFEKGVRTQRGGCGGGGWKSLDKKQKNNNADDPSQKENSGQLTAGGGGWTCTVFQGLIKSCLILTNKHVFADYSYTEMC